MVTADVKDPSSLSTRTAIVDCAIRLFAEHGYDGTSIRDIVDAAGVTKPVLYYYFKNKEDLFRSIVHGLYEEFLGKLEAVLAQPGTFLERFDAVLDLYMLHALHEMQEAYPIRLIYATAYGPRKALSLVDIEGFEKQHEKLLSAFFRQGIREKVIASRPVRALVLHFTGAITVYLQDRMMDGPMPTRKTVSLVKEFLLCGFGGTQS